MAPRFARLSLCPSDPRLVNLDFDTLICDSATVYARSLSLTQQLPKVTLLQSTRKMLAKSIPSMFDNKASTWPDPEQSIGKECLSIGELRLWLPIGPALAVYELLSKDLKDLLDNHKDALKQGEPKPRSISFSMWMIGAKPKSSNPTIVFSSKSLRQRAVAKALLKDSKLLDDYPGVRIKTMEWNPAIYQAGSQEPYTIETTGDSIDNVHNDDSEEEAVYMIDDSRGSCGALIAFGRLRLATMGGTLLINGTYYGISAQHGRYKFLEEPEDAANEDNPLRFDDDSDTEDSELENLVEITSRGKHRSLHTAMEGKLNDTSLNRKHILFLRRWFFHSYIYIYYFNKRRVSRISDWIFQNDRINTGQ